MTLYLQDKQAEAMRSRATELLYGGAAGGGKSHLVRVAAITWCELIPGIQVYIFRRTFPDVWKEHMEGPQSFPVLLGDQILAGKCKINYSDNCIRWTNGSTIFLCHCQYEKDVYSYQSTEMHVLMVCEAGQWPLSMYRYLRSRVRMVGITIPDTWPELFDASCFPRAVLTANPGGIGHNWLKSGFVDAPRGLRKMDLKDGGMIRDYIPAKLEDNAILMGSDPNYEAKLEGMGNAALVRALRNGDWDIVAGGAVDDVWDRERHVVKPFRIPASWRVDRSFDWGSSKPFSVGWWAESDGTEATLPDGTRKSWPRGTLFRIGEWYGWNGTPNEGAKLSDKMIGQGIHEREAELKNKFGVMAIMPGPADSSIFDQEPGRASIASLINEGYWGSAAKSKTDIFTTADKSPGSRKRRLAILRTMLSASLANRMESAGLFIFDTCSDGFIRTVPVLPRDDHDTDDVDTHAEDHAYDETGYRITALRHSAGGLSLGVL